MHPLVVNIKTESCDVYVGRPTKWGNPFRLKREADRQEVLANYRDYMMLTVQGQKLQGEAKIELRGKVLGCHCAPKMCHADVLAEIANA